ncbi:site-specific tyrosine recombinase XerC [Botrimarina colliarenosi]|uniref:Site-specific tyrosine recombinase XerC n=1 Tax=Botrimarina colliarenosi TaxID=2528001 RepID=A0A5C6A7M2_9BACT|nr:site-specific integrase [Botrimarina colliarenosi]TWT95390.1 site-specific tyrosine recombinase XerC [Botrimarina colliarenosi]
MSQQQKQPPKYGRHKSSGQAVVYVKGREVYLGKHGSPQSRERYREFVEKWLAQQAEEAPTQAALEAEERLAQTINAPNLREKRRAGRVVTLDELIFAYRRFAHGYYVKNGEVTREAELIDEVTGLLGRRHGKRSVESFGPVDLDEFREWVIDERDWERKSLNKQIGRVVRMYKWAVKKELCSPAAYQQLAVLGGLAKGRTRARESEPVQPVDDATVGKTIPALPEIVADMVRFQRLTGARPGEVCALRPCDLDRTGKVWLYRPDSHKTEHHGRERLVPVGPQAQKVLAAYLDRGQEEHCFSAAETVQRARQRQQALRVKNGYVLAKYAENKPNGTKRLPAKRYVVGSYRMAIRRACKKAGVPVWTPNQLRHTAATEIRRRFGLEAAQVICGHAQADVTQVYAERDLQLALSVAAELG